MTFRATENGESGWTGGYTQDNLSLGNATYWVGEFDGAVGRTTYLYIHQDVSRPDTDPIVTFKEYDYVTITRPEHVGKAVAPGSVTEIGGCAEHEGPAAVEAGVMPKVGQAVTERPEIADTTPPGFWDNYWDNLGWWSNKPPVDGWDTAMNYGKPIAGGGAAIAGAAAASVAAAGYGGVTVGQAVAAAGASVAGWFGKKAAQEAVKHIDDAYKIAVEGGKHSNFLRQYEKVPTEQIKKGIESIRRQIEMHTNKIKNPEEFIQNFKKLDPRQQEALINKKWPSDIQRQREQLSILENILKNRNLSSPKTVIPKQ